MAHCVKNAFSLEVHSQFRYVEIDVAVTKVMRSPFRLQSFFAASPMPLANFVPHGWTDKDGYHFYYDELIIPTLVEDAPSLMEDVSREPDSPRRSPLICSTPVNTADDIEPNTSCAICGDTHFLLQGLDPQMTIRARCTGRHMYHYACLATLINGIDAYANKCPICRQEICSLRRSRPVIDDEVD